MRITRIENQERRPGRKNIYVDGRFLAGVSAETLLRLGLRTGDEIGPERVRELHRTEEYLRAKNAALRLLSVRPRTVSEIRTRLLEKELPKKVVEGVIAELSSSGLLNDEEFARTYIGDALARRPVGEVFLRRKLLLLGVARETADAAIRETYRTFDAPSEAARAADMYLKRARRTSGDADDVRKLRSRLVAFLGRRGFSWSVIDAVVRNALNPPEE